MSFEHTKEEFRVCPVTNFRVHRDAQLLMTVNAVTAIVFLLIGGTMAILMGLHKTPGQVWSFVANRDYYLIVSLHGLNMLIFWIIFFEMAAVIFVATIFLNAKLYSMKLGWTSYGLMIVGALMLDLVVWLDHPNSTVMFTAYMPFKAHPLFYLGYILFAVGVLLQGINFFLTVYHAKKSGAYPHDSLPLVVYGVAVAVIIAVQAIISGAIVMVLGLLYSLDWIAATDADLWKQLFWGFGHTAQYINISATAAIWYTLIAVSTGAKPLSEKYSRLAFFFYIVFTVPVATHHLIVDPAYSVTFKIINSTLMALGLAIPSMMHAFVIPGALEKQMRVTHKDDPEVTESLYGWMKKLPWDQPAIPAIIWSILLFGVGGILGSIQGTYQLNMLTHNTLRINGHFHLTVVAGTTIAFMALAYYFLELVPGRKIIFGKLKTYQIHLFAIGLLLLSLGMFIAGVQGAPRRTATHTFYGENFTLPAWDSGLWILAIGAIIACTAGAIFITLMVFSLFFGEKLDLEGDWSTEIPKEAEQEKAHGHTGLEAPGTLSLGVLFMIVFAVFYVTTFLILGLGWKIGRIPL